MQQPSAHSSSSAGRRRFIGNTIKLIALAGIVSPFEESCKNKSKKSTSPETDNKKPNNLGSRCCRDSAASKMFW